MSSSFSQASGTIVIAASGNERLPAYARNSSTLSKDPTILTIYNLLVKVPIPESVISFSTTG